MKRFFAHSLTAVCALALAGCGMSGTDRYDEEDQSQQTAPTGQASDNLADSMASNDNGDRANDQTDIPDSEERPMMKAQVTLDRLGFGPGVIDGKMGMSTENALIGFQQANDLDQTGKLDEATKAALSKGEQYDATRVVRIPESWGQAEYQDIPDKTAKQAELKRMGYTSLDERLAERFHTTVDTLKQLNPNGRPAGMEAANASPTGSPSGTPSATPSADKATPGMQTTSYFSAGQPIRVPNIGGDRIAPGAIADADWQRTLVSLGVGSEQPQIDKIVVSKKGNTLKAFKGDKLVAMFTVSSGSSDFPLPLGEWKVVGVAHNPPYDYDPEVLTGGAKSGETYQLPPGPNGPVGIVWIDLNKEHYGIHGTPEPQSIGRAQSHGCVRLTNWDAARLAEMVKPGTKVVFEA